jgi:transcriptional regulator with XRE-family HTH domain
MATSRDRRGTPIVDRPGSGDAPPTGPLGTLRLLRRLSGLTQADLGQATGHGQGVVSRWERGVLEPTARDIAYIALALGLASDEVAAAVVCRRGRQRNARRQEPSVRQSVGLAIRAARLEAGLEPYEVAVASHVSPRRLRKIESGADPTADEIGRLAAAIGIRVASLLPSIT